MSSTLRNTPRRPRGGVLIYSWASLTARFKAQHASVAKIHLDQIDAHTRIVDQLAAQIEESTESVDAWTEIWRSTSGCETSMREIARRVGVWTAERTLAMDRPPTYERPPQGSSFDVFAPQARPVAPSMCHRIRPTDWHVNGRRSVSVGIGR